MIVNNDGSINIKEFYTSKKGNRFIVIGTESKGYSIWDTLDTIKLLDTTVTKVEKGEKLQTPYVTISRRKLQTI